MQLSIPVSILFCVGLLGCTPAHLVRLNMPPESERAEVIIHRESAFNQGGVKLVFGADKQDFVQLSNNEYARLYLSPGSYNFFVRSKGADRPYELAVSVVTNQKTCLKASANPTNLAKVLFPFAFQLGNSFLLEPVSCLSDTEIAKYSLVPVEYENKKE